MLSPGEDYKRVPRSPLDNLTFRRHVLTKARNDPKLQAELIEACRTDILFWVNVFVFQYNPDAEGAEDEEGPFVTYEFQDEAFLELLRAIEDRRDLVIEKSRDMGASWMCLLVMDWMARFHRSKKFLCVSRSAEAVDKGGDPDSLFWKLDHVHDYLPDWMKGRRKRKSMHVSYPDSGGVITGQASTKKVGIGGRGTAIFVDEFSQIDDDFAVLRDTADNSKCRIFNFTHTGTDTAAYELTTWPVLRKLVLHWHRHPVKRRGLYRYDPEAAAVNVLDGDYEFPPDYEFDRTGRPGGPFPGLRSAWYDEQVVRRGSSHGIAMNLDIDPLAAMKQFFDPITIKQLVDAHARDPAWEGDVYYDRETGRPINLEPGKGGPFKLWFVPSHDGKAAANAYKIGIDLSGGTGATPTVLSVMDKCGERVAEYVTPFVDPISFAGIAVAVAKFFADGSGNPAEMIWESQGPGVSFGKAVTEHFGFRYVYMRTDEFNLNKKVSEVPGWVPSPKSKLVVMTDYRAALTRRQCLNRSEASLKDCLQVRHAKYGVEYASKKEGDESDADVNHADRVVADALCWKLVMPIYRRPDAPPPADEYPWGSLGWRMSRRAKEREEDHAWS